MLVIRKEVFETNSSSTHTVTIYEMDENNKKSIPRNSEIPIEVDGSGREDYNYSEWAKLNVIVALLAACIESPYYETFTFDRMLNTFPQFRWINDVVVQETGTNIKYKPYEEYYPYFDTTFNDGIDVPDILECSITEENEFKTRIQRIIFDPSIIIKDCEEQY